MFAAQYKSFLTDDELEYDAYNFDDSCSSANYLITSASTFDSISSSAALELKPLHDSLKYSFLGPNESLAMVITSDLDQDQEDKLIVSLRETKEATDQTLGDIKDISPSIGQHRFHLEDNGKTY